MLSKKKIISWILTFCMVVTLLPTAALPAYAAETDTTAYENQLRENITKAIPDANDGLKDAEGQIVTIEATDSTIDMVFERPDYPALNLLMDDELTFMDVLFSFSEIKHIEIGRLDANGKVIEESLIDYELNRNPYASETESDQFNLMFNAAYAAIGEDMTKDEFYAYLRSQVADLTLEAMDGNDIAIIIHAVSEDGTEYSADYTMGFYNRYHDLRINYVDQNGDVVNAAVSSSLEKGTPYSHSVPASFSNENGNFVKVDGEPSAVSGTMEREDITVNVKFLNQAKQTSVTYQLEGEGEFVRSEVVGGKFWAPEEREGYTFSGWTVVGGGNLPASVPEGGLSLTGKYTANKYTITYYIKNTKTGVEEKVGTQTVTYGNALEVLQYEAETGWHVDRWLQRNGNTAPLKMPAADLELVADYSINTHSLNFVLNGVSYEGYPKDMEYGAAISAPVVAAKEGYTFSGWQLEGGGAVPETMPDKDVTIVATQTLNEYTVTFVIDGEETKVKYKHGEALSTHMPEAVKEGNKEVSYDFTGWTKDGSAFDNSSAVTGNMTLVANFDEKAVQYRVSFVVAGKTTDYDLKYSDNLADKAPSTARASEEPQAYTWKFIGWENADGEIVDLAEEEIAQGAVYTAAYEKVYKDYIVKFIVDGKETSKSYHYGDTITVPADPEKAADKANKYAFAGWTVTGNDAVVDLQNATVTGNASYTAKFTATPITYTVNFVIPGDTVTGQYQYNATVQVPEVPESYADGAVTYTFAGWVKDGAAVGTPTTVTVEGDATYTAKYTDGKTTFTVTYCNEVGTEVYGTEVVDYGKDATNTFVPEKSDNYYVYTFIEWVDEDGEPADLTNIQKNIEVYAAFKKETRWYTIKFVNIDGTVIDSNDKYKYNAPIAEPDTPEYSDAQYVYTFTGWDQEPGQVKGDQTFTAQYSKALRNYDVTLEIDGKKYTHTYKYGDTVKLADFGVTTEKADTAEYDYTFICWTKDGADIADLDAEKVEGKATYVAKYKAEKQKYNVTFCDEAGAVLETKTVEYGAAAKAPVPAAKESTAEFNYTFDGWEKADGTVIADMSKETIKGNLTVKAHYKTEKRSYTITWVSGSKTETTEVEYGKTPKAPEGFADIAATPQYKWTLTGWTAAGSDTVLTELPKVTGKATYTAQHKQELNYVARLVRGTQTAYYKTIEEALKNAEEIVKTDKTNNIAIIVDADTTITKDCSVPQGVTLMLPCRDNDTVFTPNDTTFNPDGTYGGKAELYRTVKVDKDATITVNGTLIVNAVTGRDRSGSGVVQDNSGGYSQLNLDGEIVVAAGGLLDVSGFVKGDGKVTALSGGKVYDLYVVKNWRGGTQALKCYNTRKKQSIYPMNESDCINIQVPVRVNYGASYEGSVKMYADGTAYGLAKDFNRARFPLINAEKGMIRHASTGTYIVKSYKDGKEVYDICGDATFENCTLVLDLGVTKINLTSSDFIYPFDGTNVFNVNNGTTTFKEDFKMLPGVEINVASGAGLTVAQKYSLALYKEFNDEPVVAGTEYASGTEAAVLNLAKNAKFTLNGEFGGKVVAHPDAVITIGDSAKTTTTTYEYGVTTNFIKYTHVYELTLTEDDTPDVPDEPDEPDTPDTPSEVDKNVYRVYGDNRFVTSIKAADALKAELGKSKFDTVIIANGMNFADALAGSYLAAVKDAPILLIDGPRAETVMNYVKSNLKSSGTVYVLGGNVAIPDSWLKGVKVQRVAGANRYETNLAILKEAGLPENPEFLVCTGNNFADSLSASATGKPILLVAGALTDIQKAYMSKLNGEEYYMIGGTVAVSDDIKKACAKYGKTYRVAGANRYETSVVVAKKFFNNPESAVLAYALNFPDGLSAGPLAYNMEAPLILTATGAQAKAVEYTKAAGIKYGIVTGGPKLISDAAVKEIFQMGAADKIIVK